MQIYNDKCQALEVMTMANKWNIETTDIYLFDS